MSKLKTFKQTKSIKRIISVILAVLIVCTCFPLSAFAAGINLGDVENNVNIPISVSTHYGHELHTTTVNGETYPLFCIEYGKSSPNSSTLANQGVPSDADVLEAARWIFAGYYMEHGNDIDWLDMAYCQKKVWSVMGDNTSWDFSSSGYNAWVSNAETNMKNLNTYPSFNNKPVGTFLAGDSYTIADSNGVLRDYPEFTYTYNGVTIQHDSGSNSLLISIDRNCTSTSFDFPNGLYHKIITGDSNNCLLYNPASGGTQKLIYSAYYDPISLYFYGYITPLGNIELTKQDIWGADVNGAEFGLYSDSACKNRIATATSADGVVKFDYLAPSTYYVKEIAAPEGYLLNDDVVKITVKSNETSNGAVENAEPTGTITLTKELDTEKTNGLFGDVKIEEAEYTLYAAEDITSKAGTHTFYKADEVVATGNITANPDGTTGTITWDELPLGNYYVEETKNPTGTFNDDTQYPVALEYADQNESVIVNDDTFSVDLIKSMKVKVFKAGSDGTAGQMPPVEGAEFTIKLYADYQNALSQGYTESEIWAQQNESGNWVYYNNKGDMITVDAERAEQANDIAPNYDVITTNANGEAVSTYYLPFGKYITKETYTPVDFESGKDFTFSITQDESEVPVEDQVKLLVVNNAPIEYPVKIVKKDADSDKTVTLSSATFKIRATEDIINTTTGDVVYPAGEYISYKVGSNTYSEFMTNSDGYVTPAINSTYASANDAKGTVTTPFKLPAGDYEVVEMKAPEGFLISTEAVPFTITSILDYDVDDDGDTVVTVTVKNEQPKAEINIDKNFVEIENVDTNLVNEIDYTQIGFKLTAAEDIIDKADGSIVYNAGTDLGNYYLNSDGTLTIKDLWIGKYNLTEIATINGAVLNDDVYTANFEVKDDTTKVYTQNLAIDNTLTVTDISKTDITGSEEIIGAELTITDTDGNIIDSWTSTEKEHRITGLVVGQTYTLTENYAPDGYVVASDIQFTVSNTSDVQKVSMVDKQVGLNKVDVDNNPVEGALLVVTNTKTKQIVDQWTTTTETHFISGLIEGQTYVIAEIETPETYVTASPLEFTVTTDKEIQYVLLVDKQVAISKTDITTGEELPGAELTVTDKDGNVVDQWISTDEPHYVTGLTENETYTLTETTCPYGYEQAESITFTVSEDKTTQLIVMEDTPIYTDVMVNKVDSATSENIVSKDFKFGIYSDPECTNEIAIISANTESGTALFEDLRYGTYYIREVAAPQGYGLSDEVVKVEINDKGVFANGVQMTEADDVYSFEYQNTLLPAVFTGDSNNRVAMYITMAAIAVIFIVAMIIVKKKMKK